MASLLVLFFEIWPAQFAYMLAAAAQTPACVSQGMSVIQTMLSICLYTFLVQL